MTEKNSSVDLLPPHPGVPIPRFMCRCAHNHIVYIHTHTSLYDSLKGKKTILNVQLGDRCLEVFSVTTLQIEPPHRTAL